MVTTPFLYSDLLPMLTNPQRPFFCLTSPCTCASVDQRVGLGLGKSIQQARAQKKMTQAALAQAINEKPSVVNQYENGKAIPNGMVSFPVSCGQSSCRHILQYLTGNICPTVVHMLADYHQN